MIDFARLVGQGLRRNKAQGALRCGIHCTSSMKVEIQNDEQITVQYYPAHYGHSQQGGEGDGSFSENSLTLAGMNGTGASSPLINGNHHHQQQQHHHPLNNSFNQYPSHSGDCSSSSSPGSASTSPSGGSNSNSNHPPVQSMERSSLTTANPLSKMNNSIANHQMHHVQQQQHHHHQQPHVSTQNSLQNHLSHCIIISPSFMVEEGVPSHSNHHATPVLVVQAQSQQAQHQQQQQQQPAQVNGHHSQNSTIVPSNSNLAVKKEKCVSDIMREAFQLLSYWPLDHHHGLVTAENEQALPPSHLNMDEHLMF